VREDIIRLIGLDKPLEIVTGFNRENLYFEVQEPAKKYEALAKYLEENSDKSGIVYCATRKDVESVCDKLNDEEYRATRYHAGLSEAERTVNQDDFLYDRKKIMVATNAFGMGIDKSNVSFVIHYNMPKSLEAYYQEAGRAGRDGVPADCILLFNGNDIRTNMYFIESPNEANNLPPEMAEEIKRKDRERLKQMTYYARTNNCLRKYILDYFGDKAECTCGNCSNCKNPRVEVDVTIESQKILSCVARAGERFGVGMIIDVLRGSKSAKIMSFGLNTNSTYGMLRELSDGKIRSIIDHLIINEYLTQTHDKYPIVKLASESRTVLTGVERVVMKVNDERIKQERPRKFDKRDMAQLFGIDKGLLQELKTLRMKFAMQQNVPAFVIFSDASILDMCQKMPSTLNEFLRVSGVGNHKQEKYGETFLEIINKYQGTKSEGEIKPRNTDKEKEDCVNEIAEQFKRLEGDTFLTYLGDTARAVIIEKLAIKMTGKESRECIKAFLTNNGLIETITEDGKSKIIPTEKGLREGVVKQERIGQNGARYEQTLYSDKIKNLLADNARIIFGELLRE